MDNEIDKALECQAVSIESPISISLISYVITPWALRLVLPIFLSCSYYLVALELGFKQAVPQPWLFRGAMTESSRERWLREEQGEGLEDVV